MRYKPDFSLLEANSTMVIETDNGNRFSFTLSARIPEKYIVACRHAIPRPLWEPACRRIILIMMVVLLFGIVLMGYIEAGYIVEPWVSFHKSKLPPIMNIGALEKLYSEFSRRKFHLLRQKMVPVSNGEISSASLRVTSKPVSPITRSVGNLASKENVGNGELRRRISASVDSALSQTGTGQIGTAQIESEEEEEIPDWVEEPVNAPDANFDEIAANAAAFEKENLPLRQNGRVSPTESLSSIPSSACFPNSDISDLNKTGDQSSSSLSSKNIESDGESDLIAKIDKKAIQDRVDFFCLK